MTEYMLTTLDNPYDPFTRYYEWDTWDTASGYNTSSLLARIVRTSDELSEADQEIAIDTAMRSIVQEDVLGVYVMVSANNKQAAPSSSSPPPSSTG